MYNRVLQGQEGKAYGTEQNHAGRYFPAQQGHGMACRDFAGHNAFHRHCYHSRSEWTVHLDTLLADNAVCYTVQNALKDETQAFARYVRQPTLKRSRPIPPPAPLPSRALRPPFLRLCPHRRGNAMPVPGTFVQGYAGYRQERMPFCSFLTSADTYIKQM